jgi:hypothetical protein
MAATYASPHTAGGTAVDTINVTGIDGGTDQAYICAIDSRAFGDTVTSVTGGGLTWTLRKTQISQRQNHTLRIYTAHGTPSSNPFTVTVVFSDATGTRTVNVIRVTGADMTAPFEAVRSWNTAGEDGSNAAGLSSTLDTTTTTASWSPTVNGSALIYIAATRGGTIGVSGHASGFTLRATSDQGAGGERLLNYAHSQDQVTAAAVTGAAHTLGAASDWATAAVLVKPAGASGPTYTDARSIGLELALSGADSYTPPGSVDLPTFPATPLRDAFNRANGALGAAWGSPIWPGQTPLQVVDNAMGFPGTAVVWHDAYLADLFGLGVQEAWGTLTMGPLTGSQHIIYARFTVGGASQPTAYALELERQAGAARKFQITKYVDGGGVDLAETLTEGFNDGDGLGIRIIGTAGTVTLEAYRRDGPSSSATFDADPFLTATDSTSPLVPASSRIGFETEVESARWEDVGGGLYTAPAPGGGAGGMLLMGVG